MLIQEDVSTVGQRIVPRQALAGVSPIRLIFELTPS